MEHELKTWPKQFIEMMYGNKAFDVRKNDRDFKVGDFLFLREWEPSTEKYTGRILSRTVTYILTGGKFGIEPDYIVMGLMLL